MEQLKSIVASLTPTPPAEAEAPEHVNHRITSKGGKQKEDNQDRLSPLQLALANSLFGGHLAITKDTNQEQFKQLVKDRWAVRKVPEAMGTFLEENTEGGKAAIPKLKDARATLFWETLKGMD